MNNTTSIRVIEFWVVVVTNECSYYTDQQSSDYFHYRYTEPYILDAIILWLKVITFNYQSIHSHKLNSLIE
jgi:hypothetical protein